MPDKIKLDIKDKKLLTLLDENSRYSNSQLAKKIQLSKPAIEYRIQRLIKNQAIYQFFTVINFTKLGFQQYKLYFQFQNASPQDEQKIIEYWTSDKNTIWVVEIKGKWDLAVSVLAKNNYEFGQVLSKFTNKFAHFILEKNVLLTEYSPIYSRTYFTNSRKKEFLYGIPEKIYELSETETKILKTIATNARLPVISIAEKTKLSRDQITYHLKKLEKENIIVQYRCELNHQKLGLHFYKIIFRMKNFDEKSENALKQFIMSHKKATQLLKLIGSWDVEIEFETETEDELYKILSEIRIKFSNVIRDYDIVRLTQTHKCTFFPF